MKIAVVANNWGRLRVENARGINAVVCDVVRGLSARGHEITVFAAHGSNFPGVNVHEVGTALNQIGLFKTDPASIPHQEAYAREVAGLLHGFDIIHSHMEQELLPYLGTIPVPVVSTIHGAEFIAREERLFRQHPDACYVGLSRGQTRALPYIHFSEVVYNGVNIQDIPFIANPQEAPYLAWIGRYTENKGVLDAIAAAKGAGMVITLVGFEEKGHNAYFQKVKALEDGANVRVLDAMIGHVKYPFLGNARAFLFPIHWEEPFGLVMVEAMACGTPVIAYDRGSVSEIVKDGVTGFIVDPKKGVAGLVEAIQRIGEIDRVACRKHVEEHFTIELMAKGYETVYKRII